MGHANEIYPSIKHFNARKYERIELLIYFNCHYKAYSFTQYGTLFQEVYWILHGFKY